MDQIKDKPLRKVMKLLEKQRQERKELFDLLQAELVENKTGINKFFEKLENSDEEKEEHLADLEKQYNSAIYKLS